MNDNAPEISREPTAMPSSLKRWAMIATALGVLLLIPAAILDFQRFVADWLAMFLFLVTIGTGALVLIAIEYIVGAKWSILFRRITENFAAVVPVSLLFAIPVIFGMTTLFEWTHHDVVMADHVLHAKAAYLNTPFFLIRLAVYFVIWIVAYLFYTKGSISQDSSGDPAFTLRARRISPVFAILYAITMTFAAVDWIMSLMPHWFSTMLGVYYGISGIVAALAVTTLAASQLRLSGMLPKAITKDHFYSLGALLFAMNTFWAYVAFAQYLLIWFGNIPIERIWFVPRTEGGWLFFTAFQVVGHFFVPFFALISRPSKMNYHRLRWVSIWVLAAHMIDMFWVVVPSVQSTPAFTWTDLGFPLLAAGVVIFVWLWRAKKSPLVAVGDPRLQESIDFHLT